MVLWVKIITVNNKLHFYTYIKIHYIYMLLGKHIKVFVSEEV